MDRPHISGKHTCHPWHKLEASAIGGPSNSMKGDHIRVFELVPEVQLNGAVTRLEGMEEQTTCTRMCAGVSAKV